MKCFASSPSSFDRIYKSFVRYSVLYSVCIMFVCAPSQASRCWHLCAPGRCFRQVRLPQSTSTTLPLLRIDFISSFIFSLLVSDICCFIFHAQRKRTRKHTRTDGFQWHILDEGDCHVNVIRVCFE